MSVKVMLLGRMAASARDALGGELGGGCRIVTMAETPVPGDRLSEFEDAEVIVGGPLTAAIIERARSLKLFHVFRGGTDGLGVELLPDGVCVCNTYHHEVSVAEFAVMAMLVLPRRVCHYDSRLRSGDWRGSVMWGEPPEQDTLVGKNVLIVGTGRIGSRIATRIKAFGASVAGVTRDPSRRVESIDRLVGFGTWREELPRADFVVASVRLAPETEGLFGTTEFASMKPSAYFINIARGTVAHERPLYEALRDGRIAGAAIDVWYHYPGRMDEVCFPSQEPFQELPNVLMSPNRSSWTKEMLAGRARDVAENVRRLASGRELINRVR